MEEVGQFLGVAFVIVLALYIVFLIIVYIVIPGIAIVLGLGATWGGGHAVVNYAKALHANIERERPTV